jgi:superfamily II RNA helicase
MFLTLLQSQSKPVPISGGGSGQAGRGKRGWTRERELFEASLVRFNDQIELKRIAKTLADSDAQANKIAKKLVDYTGELEQIESLQLELEKLQARQFDLLKQTKEQKEKEIDIQAAAAELRSLLQDDEDIVMLLMAVDEFESGQILAALGIKLH